MIMKLVNLNKVCGILWILQLIMDIGVLDLTKDYGEKLIIGCIILIHIQHP
jgi:membrane-anchored glycerophosphoryl diester phosphodiesterase (GDPDase)